MRSSATWVVRMRTALPFFFMALAVGCSSRREAAPEALALLDVRYGKIVDVYAASETAHGPGLELLARDVFVAGDAVVAGERDGTLRAAGTNPDTLRQRRHRALQRIEQYLESVGYVIGREEAR